MAETGTLSILIALALTVYGAVGLVLGKTLRSQPLLESAKRAAYLLPLVLLVSTLSLVTAFLRHDFRIEYVASHSSLAMDPVYTWVAFYAGNEGSILYISLVLAIFTALVATQASRSLVASMPYTLAILLVIQGFFLGVMATLASPFELLPFTPPDGQGINPLLTHPGMFIHPPMLMAGLIGVSVPFAIAMGVLIEGRITDAWVDIGRVWGLVIWAILGVGLLLGAWWAYTILGWGGYWAWDPIENVALMPWLILTAFIHSIMVQKRRGLFRVWNIILLNVAFTLALFGIFINRGGPVPSVHSFGASTIGWLFLAFLGVGLLFSFGVFAFRYKTIKSQSSLESMLSREAAFLANNLLFLAIAFVTLWGVVFPLISLVFRGTTVTVGAPFYNQVNGPLLLVLIFLMGIGPLLPWRNASLSSLRRAIQTPGLTAMVVLGILLALGVYKPFALIAYSLCAFVAGGIVHEWVRGTRARHRRGENYAVAFARLLAANRPRYGGYIVHLSIVALALGITGSSFYGVQRDVILAPGQQVEVGGYTVEYVGTRVRVMSDRTEFLNDLTVTRGDGEPKPMLAWRAFYPEQRMSATRAAIRSTPIEDLYIVSSESLEDGRVAFRILVNPLVWWMWVAGGILVLGTVVALWPQRVPAVALSPRTDRVATSPVGTD